MEIELSIRHTGQEWLAKNELLSVSGPSLDELDSNLRSILKEKKLLKNGEKARIFMVYDNSTIPQWIRQYTQHYFNRILEIKG